MPGTPASRTKFNLYMSESENLEDILSSMKEDRLFTLPTFPLFPPPLFIYLHVRFSWPPSIQQQRQF